MLKSTAFLFSTSNNITSGKNFTRSGNYKPKLECRPNHQARIIDLLGVTATFDIKLILLGLYVSSPY
jgi:hypothetical protein